eukprot:25162-Eustigmatos_ZCMA.PRE.1
MVRQGEAVVEMLVRGMTDPWHKDPEAPLQRLYGLNGATSGLPARRDGIARLAATQDIRQRFTPR